MDSKEKCEVEDFIRMVNIYMDFIQENGISGRIMINASNLKLLNNTTKLLSYENHKIKLWNMSNGKCDKTLTDSSFGIIEMLPKDRIAIGTNNGSIRLWSIKYAKCFRVLKCHNSEVNI